MKHKDNAFSLPIRIAYRPPKALFKFMILLHAGALLCLIPVAFPLWLKALLTLLLISYFFRFHYTYRKQIEAQKFCVLQLSRKNKWTILNNTSAVQKLELEPGAFVHSTLLVLNFACEDGKKLSFILTPENVEANSLRRLRVRLLHDKWQV